MTEAYRQNYKRMVDKNANKYPNGEDVDLVRFQDQRLLTTNASGLTGFIVIQPLIGQVLIFDGARYIGSGIVIGSETLAQTLAFGNITAGNDIIMSAGPDRIVGAEEIEIQSADGNFDINLLTGAGLAGSKGGDLNVNLGAGNAGGEGGGVLHIAGAGDGAGRGGQLRYIAGTGGINGAGGAATLRGGLAGSTAGIGGNATVEGGISSNGTHGSVFIATSGNPLGFHGVAGVQRQAITGSTSGMPALQNILVALENLGLIVDNTI